MGTKEREQDRHNLFELLALEIFVADGGVDDFQEYTDGELTKTIRDVLQSIAGDDFWIDAIRQAANRLQEAYR